MYFRKMKGFMLIIKPIIVLTGVICLLPACRNKKKPSLSGDEKVEVGDFIASFESVTLPFVVADSTLQKKDKDSFLISKAVLQQFIPDTTLTKLTGKGTKFKAYSLGKTMDENGAIYLFLKTVAGDKKSAHLLTFNKKQQFIAALTLLKPDDNKLTNQYGGIDKRFSITKGVHQKKADGSVAEGKDVYVLNEDARTFTLIMTDALGETVQELINPIDTLPRKHKYAADYTAGKMNMVSVRDGSKPDRIRFFVHIEKNNGDCTGEIKGEAFWRSSTMAEYSVNGEPCGLKLIFKTGGVSIIETNCGSKRSSINCTFDGSFTKMKYKKPVTTADTKQKTEKGTSKIVKK